MKIPLFLSICILCTYTSIAQSPEGRGKSQQGMSMNGRFYGKIVDAANNKGIDAASVQLIQSRKDSTGHSTDISVGGQLTTNRGEFSLENIPARGVYRLTITAMGYEPVEKRSIL